MWWKNGGFYVRLIYVWITQQVEPRWHTLCLSGRMEDLRFPRARPQMRPDARTGNLSKGIPRHKVQSSNCFTLHLAIFSSNSFSHSNMIWMSSNLCGTGQIQNFCHILTGARWYRCQKLFPDSERKDAPYCTFRFAEGICNLLTAAPLQLPFFEMTPQISWGEKA